MKQTKIRSLRTCPALYPHSVKHKNWNLSTQNIKLFLKLWYIVVISMLLNLVHQKMDVIVLVFKLLLLWLTLPQARQYRKKDAILFVRALITCALLSGVRFCAVRMRNAIPWNHLKLNLSWLVRTHFPALHISYIHLLGVLIGSLGLSVNFVIGQCFHFGFGSGFATLNWTALFDVISERKTRPSELCGTS